MARRPSSVRMSVNFCTNRFFSQAIGRIATKLSHDGLQVSVHPGCAQGQGQRSRDMRTFLDSWNELLRHWRSGCKYLNNNTKKCWKYGKIPANLTRKPCYHKDDHAMCPIGLYGCSANFRDSLSTPTATFPKIFHELLFLFFFLIDLKSVALPLHEKIGVPKKLGSL